MSDHHSWNSLLLSEQPHRNHATNINDLILFNTIHLICFTLIVLIVVYVTRGSLCDSIDVWLCSLFYAAPTNPVFPFRKLTKYE